jgi:hypothetical protein
MSKKQVILLAAVLSVAAVQAASGKVIYVDDDANAPGNGSSWQTAYKYLWNALQAASWGMGDEVRVAQGLYKPDQSTLGYWPRRGDRSVPIGVGGVALKGGYAGLGHADPNVRDVAAYPSILSGDLDGNDVENALDGWDAPTRLDNSYHVVRVSSSSVLDGFVITGGQAQEYRRSPWDDVWYPYAGNYGGGLYIAAGGSNITVKNCVFKDNYAEDGGGGVYVLGNGKVVFTGCTFESNRASIGGGIHVDENASIEVTDCNFVGNGGPAVYADTTGTVNMSGCDFVTNLDSGLFLISCAATITKCRFLENEWAGMVASNYSTANLSGCVFRGNSSPQHGAGLVVAFAHVGVTDSCFTGNRAAEYGGAILNYDDSELQLTRCRFSGNRAGKGGGAVMNGHATLNMANCTISDNQAPQGIALLDKAIYSSSLVGDIRLSNCILSNEGNEIWSDGAAMTIRYTAIKGGSDAVENPRGVQWGPGNLDVDACFAHPGHWDPNGTPNDPNDDFWVDGDYHLKSQAGRWDPNSQNWVIDDVTSPCIDAGDPNSPVGDEPDPNGGRINMGAYGGTKEASKSYHGEPTYWIIVGDEYKAGFRNSAAMAIRWLQGEAITEKR